MTATTPEGEEVYRNSVIYMPHPGRMCRGAEMGRGPYEKCGLVRETSLPPGKTIHQSFEITFPYQDMVKDGRFVDRILKTKRLNTRVRLWYLPFGGFDGNEVLWFEKDLSLELKGDWVWKR
ncbi:hypothetical protein HNQ76_001973 [Thermosulfuriphilus ammonigenes]|nr:hypothetical protein [Thermosulfuriphilus ammonigenes]